MLTGVLFSEANTKQDEKDNSVRPMFINRYILTDVLLSTSAKFRRPILPSITSFALPLSWWTLPALLCTLMRSVVLVFLSWLPFQQRPKVTRICVSNTSVYWHDGRAFAGCESGPPMQVLLPGLETADWWQGGWAKSLGPIKMLNEFTTAHPRIDPVTNELLLFHMSFAAPFLRVSIIPPRSSSKPPLLGAPVPGVVRPKLAHDFGATATKTIHIDLPLVLDPRNLASGTSMLSYHANMPTRFGVMPRWAPQEIQWFESESCSIFHTANAWDENDSQGEEAACLLACRLNSATLVYSAGNIATPDNCRPAAGQEERCHLYYWRFAAQSNAISHEFPLCNLPVEFPAINERFAQRQNRFVYGASMTSGSFDAGLGSRNAKIDCLVKVDVETLVRRGKARQDAGLLPRGECIDSRTVSEILESESTLADEAIKIFALPPNCYGQEATFVPRIEGGEEDDGYLVFFVFDESKGLDADGNCTPDARGELYIIDARDMKTVVCRIELPQRVPYGLHGHFFSREDIASQTPIEASKVRSWALAHKGLGPGPGLGNGGKAMTPAKPSGPIAATLEGWSDGLRGTIENLLS